MATAAVFPELETVHNPDRAKVGVICLILTEASLFAIFLTAYVFYTGKSTSGPLPKDVLTFPIWSTICLLSSSLTMELSIRDLRNGDRLWSKVWLAMTTLLGASFLAQTAFEWKELIGKGLTISTNVFGTTFYSLVGLHATHVLLGTVLMLITLLAGLFGANLRRHENRIEALSWYWHFVDTVWIAVVLTVYVFGV